MSLSVYEIVRQVAGLSSTAELPESVEYLCYCLSFAFTIFLIVVFLSFTFWLIRILYRSWLR